MRVNEKKQNIIERMTEALSKSKNPTSITLTHGEWLSFLSVCKFRIDTGFYPEWLMIDEQGYYFKGYPVLVEK